jgi:hypothetical protein
MPHDIDARLAARPAGGPALRALPANAGPVRRPGVAAAVKPDLEFLILYIVRVQGAKCNPSADSNASQVLTPLDF